jgi:hypothetical protein
VDLRVVVESTLPAIVPDAISFETGATLADATDASKFVYEHHGDEFTVIHQGSLTRFFEDLSLGRRMPTTFATRSMRDVDTMFAITLFLNRDLVLVPGMVNLVAQIDLVHRRGVSMMAHLDPFMVGFIKLLRSYFPESLAKRDMGGRIETACMWIRDLVTEGAYPAIRSGLPDVNVLDRGTGGFALAETSGDLVEGWVVLFSEGFVRGVLVSPEKEGRRQVVATRKSGFVSFDLTLATKLLNDVEAAMGEPAQWECRGDWLFSPSKGTTFAIPHMLEIFLRV